MPVHSSIRNMDFTDIIKFFNEMAERHDDTEILDTARDMVGHMRRISRETSALPNGETK